MRAIGPAPHLSMSDRAECMPKGTAPSTQRTRISGMDLLISEGALNNWETPCRSICLLMAISTAVFSKSGVAPRQCLLILSAPLLMMREAVVAREDNVSMLNSRLTAKNGLLTYESRWARRRVRSATRSTLFHLKLVLKTPGVSCHASRT